MRTGLASGIGGCGCGLITAGVSFVLCGGGSVFASWGAYEADLTRMQAETAVPLSIGVATVAAPVLGFLAFVVVGGAIYALLSRREAPQGST